MLRKQRINCVYTQKNNRITAPTREKSLGLRERAWRRPNLRRAYVVPPVTPLRRQLYPIRYNATWSLRQRSVVSWSTLRNHISQLHPKRHLTLQAGSDENMDLTENAKTPLKETEALERSRVVSNVSYKLHISLQKKKTTFDGDITINFDLSSVPDSLFLDFNGKRIHSVKV